MKENLQKLKAEVLEKLENIKDIPALMILEKHYLGRKGQLTAILRGLSQLNDEDKKKIGQLSNDVKEELSAKFSELRRIIESKSLDLSFVDVGLPAPKIARGHIHPMSQLSRDIEDMFERMGFLVIEGPELESDYYNFTALNIPSDHPARDMQDTFYIDSRSKDGNPDMVMRTHTSPMQVRAMQKYGAPLRCVVPGRVFRNEATDATHDTTFNQIEGLMIGENVSLANLSAILKEVLSGIFEQEITLRIRPGYFPFVEPGLEIDMACTICKGAKCPACKHTGWLEMLGAGMIHPNVLRYGGIDPEKYSGFAFGIGLTRLALMKYKIDDIRLFNGNDLRFLEQF
jgi:phenylalanyl-tRNA synthetase alpha chain